MNKSLKIEIDNEVWLWCELHKGKYEGKLFKEMYVKHHQNNHNKVIKTFKECIGYCKQKDYTNKPKDKLDADGKLSKEKKLQLSKEIKAALLTVGLFAEE